MQEASNGVEALELIKASEPDLLLLDISMPGMDGLTLCRMVKHCIPKLWVWGNAVP